MLFEVDMIFMHMVDGEIRYNSHTSRMRNSHQLIKRLLPPKSGIDLSWLNRPVTMVSGYPMNSVHGDERTIWIGVEWRKPDGIYT
jgi:hypothetical protein